jgi:hypothetical protein
LDREGVRVSGFTQNTATSWMACHSMNAVSTWAKPKDTGPGGARAPDTKSSLATADHSMVCGAITDNADAGAR